MLSDEVVWREGDDSDDEPPSTFQNMRHESQKLFDDSMAILDSHSSKTSNSPANVCPEAMENPSTSEDKEATKSSDDPVQDCRSAPYTSVGGVPRNSVEPEDPPNLATTSNQERRGKLDSPLYKHVLI